ncbi:ATP-binding cassette domain-containing protein [Corynebacterium poyangense]|uniref:ATP-binding cassette domain-containing protein n=1 Tax=Corynebacterium poyangense TaxID=2684405 RepID=A0A7H0SPD5_9CORY|nr:ABC transporter ATP-binding protein [Corynebacterium poyangense]MBZ8177988.1 ATP-binding cassette domain-containing protein [Corynebacterium poyangense]QNQ90410.1 ATP-binding cassette domain-containing protein [Corynebacterium poyangense]
MPEVSFHSVSLQFDDQLILDNLSFRLSEHRIGIIGENGSGKSSLVRLINGLSVATSGEVKVNGLNPARQAKEVRRLVGFIFSDADNQIIMPRVRDDVDFSLRRRGLSRDERQNRVDAVLEQFGLTEIAEQTPHSLSSGQKQLLALASVIVINPDIIIADEPTTLLDLRNRIKISRIFSQLQQQLIVVSHDLDILENFDRILCVDHHRIIADGSPHEVLPFYRTLMTERAS